MKSISSRNQFGLMGLLVALGFICTTLILAASYAGQADIYLTSFFAVVTFALFGGPWVGGAVAILSILFGILVPNQFPEALRLGSQTNTLSLLFLGQSVFICIAIELQNRRRRRAQTQTKVSEKKYRSLFQLAAVGIGQVDVKTARITTANQKFADITGYSPTELAERSFSELTHPEDREKDFEEFKAMIRGETPVYHTEKRYIRKDGKIIFVRVDSSIAEWDESNKPLRTVGVLQDVTQERETMEQLKKREEDLAIAAEDARRANAAKSIFLANMSHEIRTPMNSILGFADLVLDSSYTEDKRHYFARRIKDNGQLLLQLINDILDLSRFEASGISVEKSLFDPASLIQDVLSDFRLPADAKGIKFDVMFDDEKSPLIFSDAIRLKQILNNLVGNAVKFSNAGVITIQSRFSTKKDDPNERQLTIDITDEGIGISSENQAKLFNAFVQSDSSINRKYGGSGLGLQLSQLIANSLGGTVVLVSSSLGHGSCFRVTISCGSHQDLEKAVERTNQSGSEAQTQAQKNSLNTGDQVMKNISVLLAEDSPDNEMLVRAYLEKVGAKIDTARNGHEAVKTAQTSNYDVILMDIQMPDLDGLEATRQLRNIGYTKPICGLSAGAHKNEIQAALQAGCDSYLVKPVSRNDLISEIFRLRNIHTSAPINS